MGDRIQWMGGLVIASFVATLVLSSQSAASLVTYLLLATMLVTINQWRDVFALPLMWIAAGLVGWLCFSVFWSEAFAWRGVLSIWIRGVLVLAFVIAVAECQLRGQMQRWIGVSMALVGAATVMAALANFYLTNPADGRLNGLGQLDTHVVAALIYAAILLMVLHFAAYAKSGFVTVLAVAFGLAAGWAIFLSDSRNAWVALIIGLATYGIAIRSHSWREFLAVLLPVGVLLLVGLVVFVQTDAGQALLLPRGTSFRPVIWQYTIDAFPSAWAYLWGRGILTPDDVVWQHAVFEHPHSLYLSLLHQGGVIAVGGFGLLLLQVVRVYAANFQAADSKLGLAILTMACSAYILDGHELIDKVGDTWFLVWFPVGLALGLSWRPQGFQSDE